ncbi:hypothetical protein D3C87_1292610 [compost metagenome]
MEGNAPVLNERLSRCNIKQGFFAGRMQVCVHPIDRFCVEGSRQVAAGIKANDVDIDGGTIDDPRLIPPNFKHTACVGYWLQYPSARPAADGISSDKPSSSNFAGLHQLPSLDEPKADEVGPLGHTVLICPAQAVDVFFL